MNANQNINTAGASLFSIQLCL